MAAPPAAINSKAPSATAPSQSNSQPGLFSQMAATAGGVAVGSTIGHGLSNMFFGGSAAAEEPVQTSQQQQQQQQATGARCDVQAKDFTKCLEVTNSDFGSCSYYLEQLKACQAAAAPY